MAGGVEAGDAVTMGASAARWLSSTRRQSLTYLEPSVGDVGGDLLHGVEAEVAAVGEDRGQQRADLPGVDLLLPRLLEVDAEPEVVLDLDEQVGQPDGAAAGVQPAVQLGEAARLRRVGRLGRVRLQPPPVVVERDLPVVSNTFPGSVSPQASLSTDGRPQCGLSAGARWHRGHLNGRNGWTCRRGRGTRFQRRERRRVRPCRTGH